MNICIIAHLAYGAITGGNRGHAGGVEHQTSLMARWFASRGHRVSLLTWNEGERGEEYIDGVRVIKMCRQNEGVRGVRFFHPRWTSLNRCMKKVDAEIYYHNCAEYATGQIALWCRLQERRFIYSIASDAECEVISPATRSCRDRLFFSYGLRKANQIVVQTQKQQHMLRNNFALDSVILPMPCRGTLDDEAGTCHLHEQGQCKILWAGRIDKEKRLEMLLDVAGALPHVTFEIAGKPSNAGDPYADDLLARAALLPNVILHGMVPRDQMSNLYLGASLLCCTSIYEGFPNTFLEAWSYGLPIVSTFEPDDLLSKKKLGIYVKNTAEMISQIQTLIQSPKKWQQLSENARKYYRENHALDMSMPRFEDLFLRVRVN